MPRHITKSSLAAEESEIGLRFREFRLNLGWSVARIAKALDIPRVTYTAYEMGTVRVPWSLVLKAWQRLALNPGWLATSEGLPRMIFPEPFRSLPRVDGTIRFSDVWPKLAPVFAAIEDDMRAHYVEQVAAFLSDAKEGKTPRGALALVAAAIHEHTSSGGPVKVVIRNSESPAAPTQAPISTTP